MHTRHKRKMKKEDAHERSDLDEHRSHLNLQLQATTVNCTRSIIRTTWPHPLSEAARSNLLCEQQLYIPGRSDATLVAQEGKRNIIPRALKTVVGLR